MKGSVIMKRKIRYRNGEWQDCWVKGQRNPCGCGSNVFHEELTSTGKVYGVCNVCGQDIYELDYTKEEIEQMEWHEQKEETKVAK